MIRAEDHFFPICGSFESEKKCFFLHFEGFNILLDCGFGREQYSKIKEISPKLDIVLLSHCCSEHLCGLPFLLNECEFNGQIFSTIPTMKLGEMSLYEGILNLNRVSEIDFDLELTKIDEAFKKIKELKYTERFVIKNEEKDQLVVVQAFNSGFSLGGTVWVITNEIDHLVYCVDFDIKQSSFLAGLDLKRLTTKPTLFIIDGKCKPIPKKSKLTIDRNSFEKIVMDTVKRNGKVLIPSDACGRSLEIISVLEALWRRTPTLNVIPCVFLSTMSLRTVKTYASQQIQYMHGGIIQAFNQRRANPFHLRHVILASSMKEVQLIMKRSKGLVVITSDLEIENGFSKDLFISFATDEKNLILFLDTPHANSIGRKFVDLLKTGDTLPDTFSFNLSRKEPLKGEALVNWRMKRKEEREMEAKRKREEEQKKKIVHIMDEEIDSEFEESGQNERLFLPENVRYQSRYLMFPPRIEKIIPEDDFGELIDVDALKKISLQLLEADANTTVPQPKVNNQNRANVNKVEKEVIPMNVVKQKVTVPLRAKLMLRIFDGRATVDSVKNILQKIKPRQVIFVSASLSHKNALKLFCEKNNITRKEFLSAPQVFQSVKVYSQTDVFKVILESNLLDVKYITKYKEHEMAFFEGKYSKEGSGETNEDLMDTSGDDEKEKLKIVRREDDLGHDPIFIGNVKLNEFRSVLNSKGIATKFKVGGGIICNGVVLLTKEKVFDVFFSNFNNVEVTKNYDQWTTLS